MPEMSNTGGFSNKFFIFRDAFREVVCLYGGNEKLKDMKTIEKKVVVITGIIVLTLVSCSKESRNVYSDSAWSGENPIRMVNGTTGELEDHTAVMTLYFQHDGLECIVETGIAGLCAANRIRYEARWSRENQFALYSSSGGQSLLCYSGTISGRILTLRVLNCDGVAATYELTRMPLQE